MTGPLPWQAPTWARLRAAAANNRLPHALLFAGPAGVGKRRLAEALARALLCREAGDTACGHCADCQRMDAGSHADFARVEPAETGRQILIDQVRRLIAGLHLGSDRADGYRITLIQPAEAMNVNAANAVLKSLEEPPPGRLLILVSDQPARLPVTIRSRCQLWRLAPPPADQGLAWLAEQGVDNAPSLLRQAANRPLLALAAAEDQARRSAWAEQFGQLLDGAASPVEVAKDWAPAAGEDALWAWWAGWLLDLARLHQQLPAEQLQNPDQQQRLAHQAGALEPRALLTYLHKVLTSRNLLRSNVQPQLLLESLLVHWGRRLQGLAPRHDE